MRPLDGIRVLELGQVIAAPYAGVVLADLGAEVIKVERPGRGDSARDNQVAGIGEHSATFLAFNRNKRSMTVDLRSSAGRNAFYRQIEDADVFLTNLLPGAAGRLGVDPESLRARNPRLVTCSVTGYGADHPMSNVPSYDLVHQALAGYLMLNGLPTEPPSRVGIPIADLSSGLFAALGIVGALRAREVTGVGDDVDVSMYDSLLSLLSYQATMYLTAGVAPERIGTAHEFVVPWGAFPTADGQLVVAIRTNHFWVGMCRGLELEDLIEDPRFIDNASRLAHREELEAILAERFSRDETESLVLLLSSHGIPCAPVREPGQGLDDENLRGGNLVSSFGMPGLGPVKAVRTPTRFANAEPVPFVAPPELGESGHIGEDLVSGRPPTLPNGAGSPAQSRPPSGEAN